jgi:hypothetical protein
VLRALRAGRYFPERSGTTAIQALAQAKPTKSYGVGLTKADEIDQTPKNRSMASWF